MPQGLTEAQKEMVFKDQGERFKTIVSLSQMMNDSNWDTIRDQIEMAASQGLRYLVHFEDLPEPMPEDESAGL